MSTAILLTLFAFLFMVSVTLVFRHVEGMAFPATVVGILTLAIPHTLISVLDRGAYEALNHLLCCNYFMVFPIFVVIGIGNAVHTVVKYRKLLAQKLAAVTVSHDEIDDLLNYGAILGIRGVPIEVFKNYLLYDDAPELAPVPKKICEALKILSTPASVAIPYYCTWERSGAYVIKYAVCGEPLVRAVAAGHGVEEARDQLILHVLDSYYHCIYPSLTIILDAVLYSFVFWWIEMLNPVYTFVQTTMLRQRRNQP